MMFGLKEKKSPLGQFTSDKCSSCKKGHKYIFYRITRFIVIFFIKLIPVSNRYEAECSDCSDTSKIDKKAGSQIAKQKFSVENGNQNFLIFIKLFLAAALIAAAIVFPLTLVGPPISPQTMKDLIKEPGHYTIVDKDDTIIAIVDVTEEGSAIQFYNDISSYKTSDGKKFELNKSYEEIKTADGSYMSPIADSFGSLTDENGVKVQNYYYDILKGTYGFQVGVRDLSAIEYSESKIVYPLSYYASADLIYNYKLVIYKGDGWEIDVRFEVADDGSETLIDLLLIRLKDGLSVSETMYLPNAKDGSLVYLGNLSSASIGQEYYDFIANNDLEISYIDSFSYYKNTGVITSSKTTTTDEYGGTGVTEANYNVVKKYRFYILNEAQ